MRSLLLALAFAFACWTSLDALAAGGADGATARVIGWIEIRPAAGKKDQITIVGHAHGIDQTAGRFVLSVQRTGKSGSAKTGQTGTFSVAAGQDAVLSSTAIDVSPSASIVIELKLLVGDQEVFSTTLKSAAAAGGGTEL